MTGERREGVVLLELIGNRKRGLWLENLERRCFDWVLGWLYTQMVSTLTIQYSRRPQRRIVGYSSVCHIHGAKISDYLKACKTTQGNGQHLCGSLIISGCVNP